jgi:hypothetical protein
LPEPLLPEAIVIHDELSDAVQAQPVGAVTLALLAPPLATTLCDVGFTA